MAGSRRDGHPHTSSTGSSSSTRTGPKAYGPSFAAANTAVQGARRKERVSPYKQGLNPADIATFQRSMVKLFAGIDGQEDRKAGDTQSEAPEGDRHDREVGGVQASEVEAAAGGTSTSGGFEWAKMLDVVARRGALGPHDAQTPVVAEETTQRTTAGEPTSVEDSGLTAGSALSSSTQAHGDQDLLTTLSAGDERLHDHLQKQVDVSAYCTQLREEAKSLTDAADALNWMEDKLFSQTNPDALIHKISDVSITPNSQYLSHYPYLLVDLTRHLRGISPHIALLPLKLASQRSSISYLYGCTTPLYCENLRIFWEEWGDIEGCLGLLQEMDRAAVPFNSYITSLVAKISDAVVADSLRARELVDAEYAEQQRAQAAAATTTTASEVAAESTVQGAAQDEHAESPSTESEVVEARPDSSAVESTEPAALEPTIMPESNEKEALIASRMFFSAAQRRSVRLMDQLVETHLARLAEARREAEQLESVIQQQIRSETKESSGDGRPKSTVNRLVDSYGSFVRPERRFAGQDDSSVPEFRSLRDAVREGRYVRHRGRPVEGVNSRVTKPPSSSKRSTVPEVSIDVLSEAVSALLVEQPKKKRSSPSRTPKGRSSKSTSKQPSSSEDTTRVALPSSP